jgi:hypothetical protein
MHFKPITWPSEMKHEKPYVIRDGDTLVSIW